jgi:anti-anti-sigma regulatory factor
MATITDWLKVDGERVSESLRQALKEKLSDADGELVVDFAGVKRIDPAAIAAMKDLADETKKKSVKVVLRGVNIDVYKVLKLARLTTRFSILA